jgi:hypothetical protein
MIPAQPNLFAVRVWLSDDIVSRDRVLGFITNPEAEMNEDGSISNPVLVVVHEEDSGLISAVAPVSDPSAHAFWAGIVPGDSADGQYDGIYLDRAYQWADVQKRLAPRG